MAPYERIILATLSEDREYIPPEGKNGIQAGTLNTKIEVEEYADNESLRRLEVEFRLRTGRQTKGPEIGHLIAWLVDTTAANSIRAKQAQISEVLAPKDKKKASTAKGSKERKRDEGDEDEDEDEEVDVMKELKNTLNVLFTKAGKLRSTVKEYQDELSSSRLIFIDTLFVDEDYRGTGLTQLGMQSLHHLIQYVDLEGESEEARPVTIVLSPGASEEHPIPNGKTPVEIERSLIRSYEKSDYKVWIQGDEDIEGSVTIMGRVVND